MGLSSVSHLRGKKVEEGIMGTFGSYAPSSLRIRFDDGTVLVVKAISVHYDQYSSSPALDVTEQEA